MSCRNQLPCLSPKVVSYETDISDFVGATSANITAMLGASAKGRTDRPVFVTSPRQLTRTFGRAVASHPSALGRPTYAAYNAQNFLEFGNQLYFQRVDASGIPKAVGYAPVPASIDFDVATGVFSVNWSATDLFKFEALGEGEWGGKLFVEISVPKGQFDQRQDFTGSTNFDFSVLVWEIIENEGVCTSTLIEEFRNVRLNSCSAILENSNQISLNSVSTLAIPSSAPDWFNAGTLQGLIDVAFSNLNDRLALIAPMGWEYTDQDLSPLNASDFFPSMTASIPGPYTMTDTVNDIIALDVKTAVGAIVPAVVLLDGFIDLAGGTALSVSDVVIAINAGTGTHGIFADTDSQGRLVLIADVATHGTGAVVRIATALHTSQTVFGFFGFLGSFLTNVSPDLQNCFDVDTDGEPAKICGQLRFSRTTNINIGGAPTAVPTNVAGSLTIPVYPGSVVFTWEEGAVVKTATDDGVGGLVGDIDGGGLNTIDYVTGAFDFDSVGGIDDNGAADVVGTFDSGILDISAGVDDTIRLNLVCGTQVSDLEITYTDGSVDADTLSNDINAALATEQVYDSEVQSSGALPGPLSTAGGGAGADLSFELFDTTQVLTPTVVAVTLTVNASKPVSEIIAEINSGSGGNLTADFDFTTNEIRIVPANGSGFDRIRVTDGTITSGLLFPDNALAGTLFVAQSEDANGEVDASPTTAPLDLCIRSIEAGESYTVTILAPAAQSGVAILGFAVGQSDVGKDPFVTLQNQVVSLNGAFNGATDVALGGELGCLFFLALNVSDIQIEGNAFDNDPVTVCTTPYVPLTDVELASLLCTKLVGADAATDASGGSFTPGSLAIASQLGDYEQLIYNILQVPGNMGLRTDNAEAVINCACALAECRQDLLYLVDMDQGLRVDAAVTYRNARLPSSSFCETGWPWLKVQDVDAECGLLMPQSFGLSQIIPFNDSIGEPWFAAAGLNRGRAFRVLGLEFTGDLAATQGDRDALYSNQINFYQDHPGEGVVHMGNNTLQRRNSALNKINVRRLLNFTKQLVDRTARNFLFEPNDSITHRRYRNTITPFLEDIRLRRGLLEFRVDTGPDVNTPEVIERSEMCARIFLKPTKSIECICNDFVIVRQDAAL